jgi:hypothetical protein
MTLPEALALLRNAGVPDWFYVADGGLGTGECIGIARDGSGWLIYYSERGRKSPLQHCADEDSACRAFLRDIDEMMRKSGRGGLPAF